MKSFILASSLAVVLISCGGGGVYVSGRNGATAVYWQDGAQHNLNNDGLYAHASGIFVDSGNVYLSGTCTDAHNNKACYWKNGERTYLKNKAADDYIQTFGNGIYVANNNVYVAGSIAYLGDSQHNTAAYWVDNTASCTEISTKTVATADATSIFAYTAGGHIYVGGMETTGDLTSDDNASYWDNDTLVTLPSKGYITSIYASGGQLYSVGYETSVEKTSAIYYAGNQKQTLALPSNALSSKATGVYVYGSDVYISGVYDTAASTDPSLATGWITCYWKNGVRVDIPVPNAEGDYAYTSGIFVKNNDVYVSGGYDSATSRKMIACYWKNGTKTDLTFVPEKADAETTGIFVD